jgi:class 3 adenylate cyclase/tetratricopeptide (TPR) repeat protein
MSCRGCGADNRAGRKFCSECGAPLEVLCPACGAANEPSDKFCGGCGASLPDKGAAPAAPTTAGASVSERRLVSVLFADLVGFTALSEHRDPEEVRELLSRYFDRCRTLIERYGGTVEKFIGDAVMAVWGTPVAREDDTERAVRAALALVRAVSALGAEVGMPELRVRAGVLTGRAAVEVGAEGEGMVLGDTVNSASRLQSIAAPGTVLVDDVTRRASEAAIAYEDAGTHQVKGREQPIHAWIALRVVAGAGGARRSTGLEAPLVGRDRELEAIIEAAEMSAAERRATLVTVVGEAGTGKSRLLWEFFKYLDGIEAVRWWHQGRCLSYGDGVAYWGLAEMVRARAGIVEEDEDPASAREKLRALVAAHVPDERERRLVEPRLAQLLGFEQRGATEAGDLFSGWRLFFERMAASNPVILAFEDLQWADSGLLDFIDYLLEWSADHPIFVLALARPELDARRPGWGTRIALTPLPTAAMRALLDGLAPGLPDELLDRIDERADGVPLYAVETVRMLLDRGVLTQDGARYVLSGDAGDLDVPETLHALVAARLDDLGLSERGLLQDAAVLGSSFSIGALAAVSGRPEPEVHGTLGSLVAKQVLGYDDDPRSAERGQYHFLQGLVRTIALGTLARRDRKARHLAAAEYLRASWGEQAEIAEVLASHYLAAVEAEPDAADADAIRAWARETLTTAGHRAVSLALGEQAQRYFEQAAGLAGDASERAQLLAEAGAAATRGADHDAARRLLGEAIAVFDARGLTEDAARTRALLVDALIMENRIEEAVELIDRARESLTDRTVLAGLAARRARLAFLAGDFGRARDEADLSLSIADPLQLAPVIADAAITRAISLYYDRRITEADAMMSLGLQVALDADLTESSLRGYYNLADFRCLTGQLDEAAELLVRGLALAHERGNRVWERYLLDQQAQVHTLRGEWDEALALIDTLRSGSADDHPSPASTREPLILAARGDTPGLQMWLARPAPPSEWLEQAVLASAGRATVLRAAGLLDEAVGALDSAAPELARSYPISWGLYAGEIVDTLLEAGLPARVEELLALSAHPRCPLIAGQRSRASALLLARKGELDAADRELVGAVSALRAAGDPFALARALLDRGTLLTDRGHPEDAEPILEEARALFERLRATPWLERTTRALRTPVSTAA